MQGDYEAFLFNTFLAYSVAAAGTVFLIGWAGQVSFAQGAFFGIGAYSTAHLARGADPGYPVTVLVAATCAAVLALPMAIPSVRLRGVFLALITLAYQAAVERFLFRQQWFTLGGEAISIGDPHLVGGTGVHTQRALALAMIPLAAGLFLTVRAVRRSKVGRALVGLHRQEGAMAACGVAIPRYRLLAFVSAAWMAGAGGSLLTYALMSAPGSNEYTIVKSTVLLAIPVIGGITRLGGAVVGAALFVGLPEVLKRLQVDNFNLNAVMGLGLFVSAVVLRGGILGALDRVRQRDAARLAWLRRPAPRADAERVAPYGMQVTLAGGQCLRIVNSAPGSGGEVTAGASR
jgi:branched-chain amino acid transport system permease protein